MLVAYYAMYVCMCARGGGKGTNHLPSVVCRLVSSSFCVLVATACLLVCLPAGGYYFRPEKENSSRANTAGAKASRGGHTQNLHMPLLINHSL